MTDYTKFDAALLVEIRNRPQAVIDLTMDAVLSSLARSMAKPDACGYRKPDRIFDRRLQSLRRAGKIRYTGKVWEAIDD